MNYLISVCIPSYNRPQLLKSALVSIEKELSSGLIQICISNNNSSESYLDIENYLDGLNTSSVIYQKQTRGLSIDENMHACAKLCSGKYIYYLGDDDYFLEGGVRILIGKLQENEIDILIPKAINVSADGSVISDVNFNLRDSNFTVKEGFRVLSENQTFGALLVRRNLVSDSTFRLLNGTSHAYGGFWIDLDRELFGREQAIRFCTTEEPIVALRQGAKTYTGYMAEVFYEHIPSWFFRIKSNATSGELREAAENVGRAYVRRTSTFKHTIFYLMMGVPPFKIIKSSRNFFGLGLIVKVLLFAWIPRNLLSRIYFFIKRIVKRRHGNVGHLAK